MLKKTFIMEQSMEPHLSFRHMLAEDLRACHIPVPERATLVRLLKDLFFALATRHHFACVFHYRLNAMLGRRFPRFAGLMAQQRFYIFGNDISHRARIGPGFRIHHTSDIVIGRAARIGKNFHIYNGVTLGSKSQSRPDEMPTIGDNVLIGTGAKVLGNIRIGDNAVIGALTFCDKDVPPNTIAIGNPMRFLEMPASFRS